MVRILICDDDAIFAAHLKQLLERYTAELGISCRITVLHDPERISDTMLQGCEIAFLDIDMPGRMSGIEVARNLRQMRRDSVIVFVTNYIEYAPEGYEVNAFRYLLKRDCEAKLKPYLAQAVDLLMKERKVITLQCGGELIDIAIDHILFIESRLRQVHVHTDLKDRNSYIFYATMSDLETKLEPLGFLRTHKSFLVNMKKIKKLCAYETTLTDGTVLRVSEKNYSAIKQKYLTWRGMI